MRIDIDGESGGARNSKPYEESDSKLKRIKLPDI